jgi:hypothetical protein
MYKFKVGAETRRQLGECPICLNRYARFGELTEWGMCAQCYLLEVIDPLLRAVIRDLHIFMGADASVDEYIAERVEAILKRKGIKREIAPKDWVPGME